MRKYFIRMMTGEEVVVEADKMVLQEGMVAFYAEQKDGEAYSCGACDKYLSCVGIINNYDYCCTVKEAS